MICFPNAKINLGLNIISRRADGYHNIETIFYPIGMKDALEVINSEVCLNDDKYRLFQYGDIVECDYANNLVIKAFSIISAERDLSNIDIHLLKKIPSGAGLGGGSADASFMLKIMNEKFDLGYSVEELMKFAAKIGADCSFFLHNKPAFATGIGDMLETVDLNLEGYHFVVVKPNVLISTKEAYSMIVPAKPSVSLKEIVKKPVEEWSDIMKNDFEIPIFKKYPVICNVKCKLQEMGAIYSSMSGSGSAVYGIFDSKPELEGFFSDCFVWKSWD